MFKKKSHKAGRYTRLINRPESGFIYAIRFGRRAVSSFRDTPQGWLDAVDYYYQLDLANDGIESLRPSIPSKPLITAFTAFMSEYAEFRAQKTREQYLYAMKFFFPDPSILTNNTEAIAHAIQTAKRSTKVSETTINSYMRSLRKFFNWCIKKKWMKENPIDNDNIPKPDRAEPKNWEDDELDRIFEYLKKKDVEFYCLCRLIYVTSMRIHQALELRWENILREDECIRIKRKGRKEAYYYPITHQVESVLQLLQPLSYDRERLFTWKSVSRKRLYDRLTSACEELGIDRNGRAFHVFRKTRITKLAEKNMLLTSQSSDVSIKTMENNYIRKKNARAMKEFLEQE